MNRFERAFSVMSHALGSPVGVCLNLASVLIWLPFGPAFHWGQAWQMPYTLYLSIDAIFMAVVIQAEQVASSRIAQRRDEALHRKIDALIDAIPDADDQLEGSEKES